MSDKKVVTRFPPSPTGPLHLGNVRTALFNYLFARKHGGQFIVRVEDTDALRSKKEFELDMFDSLKWFGIHKDNEEVWRQSERGEVYKKYLHRLIDEKRAYLSQETEGENREVVRFKNPNKKVAFDDLVRGTVTFDTTELGDFIIARNINEPVYHLAVVADDFEAGVTHVIRGEDHISNTPRHILIQEAIGAPRPIYAHLPLILAPDRSKLSKRKHGESVSINFYRDKAYLPEAFVNYLALLGWNPGDDREIFSLEELVKVFDLSKVQKGGAIFNIEKLNWFNKQYIQKLSLKEKVEHLKQLGAPYEKELAEKPVLVELMTERIANFAELRDLLAAGEYDYFFGKPRYEKNSLLWKGTGDAAKTKERLAATEKLLENLLAASFTKENIKNAVWPYAEREGRGEVLWPFRVALSGREKSPDPFTLAEMLGKEETLARIAEAINLLS